MFESIRDVGSSLYQQYLMLTPMEQQLLESDAESTLFRRYAVEMTVPTRYGLVQVHTVQAPQPDAKRSVELPPVILIHGMGGQLPCFKLLAADLNRFCCVIAIDLPGHGKSPDPENWNVMEPEVTVEILKHIIQEACGDTPFVLVGHSLGSVHALRVGSLPQFKERCKGVIAIAPPHRENPWTYQRLMLRYMPQLVFDAGFRSADRRGELDSPSVKRSVAASANDDVRRQQLQINVQARTLTVLQTLARVRFYSPSSEGHPDCPILVIGASDDHVCPVEQARSLTSALEPLAQFAEVPAAGHSVLFEQPEIISGVIGHFLRERVDERLSMAWHLQYLASREDKWSLKNEQKWLQTEPVGARVGKSWLCGMKMLRQNDPEHGPAALEENHVEVKAVIDISRDTPPYDPQSFEHIKYYKFPTVSKIPPHKSEVTKFIKLVKSVESSVLSDESGLIGVHCHYGFNRTGFFICSYLIEELAYSVSDALSAYAESRPSGIRHRHFIDELHLRYNLRP